MRTKKKRLVLVLGALRGLYAGSYVALSRRGYAEADRYNMHGYYYFFPEKSNAWRVTNYGCVYLFWPLNAVDRWLGPGRYPAAEPFWGLTAAEPERSAREGGVITLRPYRPDDAPALLALFRDTIRRVNCRDYSPAQVAAWASDDIDTGRWFGRFSGRFVPVAEEAGRPVGFAELESDGHIDRVYISADHQRRGIGRQLLAAVLAEARRVGLARLFTEASVTARPFFEAQGFTVLAPQVVTCRGAEFVNYQMGRVLADLAGAADRRGISRFWSS